MTNEISIVDNKRVGILKVNMREIPLPSLTIVGRETRRNSVIPRAKGL